MADDALSGRAARDAERGAPDEERDGGRTKSGSEQRRFAVAEDAGALRVSVFDAAADVALAAADHLAYAVARNSSLVVALPTGNTPLPFYDELARRHRAGEIDLARVRAFNLDELALAPGDPRSFRSYMERHAWGRTGLRRERCDIPDGAASDRAAECARYEAAIGAAGGLDLAILGLGADGHVAYDLPGPVVEPTHLATLPDALAAALGIPDAERPLRAITMGLGTLAAARELLLLATGAAKARAVAALVAASRGAEVRPEEWPCAWLARHPRFTVMVDRQAAERLPSSSS